jgi:hypothetical protein
MGVHQAVLALDAVDEMTVKVVAEPTTWHVGVGDMSPPAEPRPALVEISTTATNASFMVAADAMVPGALVGDSAALEVEEVEVPNALDKPEPPELHPADTPTASRAASQCDRRPRPTTASR